MLVSHWVVVSAKANLTILMPHVRTSAAYIKTVCEPQRRKQQQQRKRVCTGVFCAFPLRWGKRRKTEPL